MPPTAPSATHPPRGRPPRRCGGPALRRSCPTGHPPTGRQSTAARGGGGGAGGGSVSGRASWRREQPYSLPTRAPSPGRAGSGFSHSHKRTGSRKPPESSAKGSWPHSTWEKHPRRVSAGRRNGPKTHLVGHVGQQGVAGGGSLQRGHAGGGSGLLQPWAASQMVCELDWERV